MYQSSIFQEVRSRLEHELGYYDSTKYCSPFLIKLLPGENIGLNSHPDADQLVLVVDGQGIVNYGGVRIKVKKGDSIFIRSGRMHDFINSGFEKMILAVSFSHALPIETNIKGKWNKIKKFSRIFYFR